MPIAIALVALGALSAYVSTWWTIVNPGDEIRLLATIFVLGTIALVCVVYWLALRGQTRSDERYYELKSLAERVAQAVTLRSSTDELPVTCANPSHVGLADEVAGIRLAVARIERLAADGAESYLRGYTARVEEEDGENGPPLVA